jgi:uncharacterized protein
MTQPGPRPPVPVPQPETDFYWKKAKAGELWLMRCNSCDTTYFYPRPICPRCFSRDTTWIHSSGRGTLYAFSIIHRPPTPAFQDSVPYVAALVELEGGARLPTNLVEVEPDPAGIHIGMAVEVVFDDVSAEIALPKFRPVRAG